MPSSNTSSRASSVKAKYPLLSGGFCEETDKELHECDVRFNFLGISCVSMVFVASCGFVIGAFTNSDMVTVDFWDMCADVFGLLLSMKVERMKKVFMANRSEDNEIENRTQVLIADAIGGCVSFMVLVGVVITGALLSFNSIEDPTVDRVKNRKWIIFYAFISVTGDVIPLYYFSTTTSSSASDSDSNKLNILSGLLHMSIDLLRALVTLVSTTIMLIMPTSRTFDTEIDGYGSMVICVLVLSSAVWVAHEAVHTYNEVQCLQLQSAENLKPI